VYKDFDNKWMTLRMSDMGNCRLPGVASVPPKRLDAYDPGTRTYKKEPSEGIHAHEAGEASLALRNHGELRLYHKPPYKISGYLFSLFFGFGAPNFEQR
jgi:hypothetical protein